MLISINPYHHVPLYGTERCRVLAEQDETMPDEPHVYTLARKAHRDLLHSAASHSIVISGESGAGKTEASKRVIEYLAFASKKSREPPPLPPAMRTPSGRRVSFGTPGSRSRSISGGGGATPRRARCATTGGAGAFTTPSRGSIASVGSSKLGLGGSRPAALDDDAAVLAALAASGGDRTMERPDRSVDRGRAATVAASRPAAGRRVTISAAAAGGATRDAGGDGLGREDMPLNRR